MFSWAAYLYYRMQHTFGKFIRWQKIAEYTVEDKFQQLIRSENLLKITIFHIDTVTFYDNRNCSTRRTQKSATVRISQAIKQSKQV